eukprot:TRINITY_DN14727_c0_g1_i1.p1 TRINITY_DN14727_c0_g1~~TRINITY_DN14727_c0_g1_i1.p1  ORF type:complete len:441 (-),score=97.03 TRINITY_DN14727_c0_g1_i1:32-1354(-)
MLSKTHPNISSRAFSMRRLRLAAVVLPVLLVADFLIGRYVVPLSSRFVYFQMHLLLMFGCVLLSIHYALYRWFASRLQLPHSLWRRVFVLLWLVIALPGAFGHLIGRTFGGGVRPQLFVLFAFISLAYVLMLALAVGAVSAGTALLQCFGVLPLSQAEQTRRKFSRQQALVAFCISLMLCFLGLWSAAQDPVIVNVDVPMQRLPQSLDGFRVVHVSDIHAGPTVGVVRVQRIVEIVNSLDADIVAITGDLIDGTIDRYLDILEPLRNIKAKHGVFYVTGNHEYYHGDPKHWLAHLRSMGVTPLRNERVAVPAQGDSFDLAGVDDISAGNTFVPGHAMDLKRALGNRQAGRATVLLAHQPAVIKHASVFGINLMLSGHVHGGQIFPFHVFAYLGNPYFAGSYQHDEHTHVFVSRGAGWFGPPVRLFAPADIGLIRLRAKSQ